MELPATVFVGDMSDFTLKKPVDAAFNTINSFRHLRTEESARAHLECMSRAVRAGGIYVLGLHLTPTRGTPIEEESWSARRGNLQVNTRMWTISRNMRRREELCGMEIFVQKPTGSMCIEDEIIFRTYTWPQMESLLASVPDWEIAATFDFAYDLRRENTVDAQTEDVVFILRRK